LTAFEVISAIEIMLDDKSWFPYFKTNIQFLYDMISIAQIKTIEKYYATQDERVLRSLYVIQPNVFDGDAINIEVMYPRTLILYKEEGTPYSAKYLPSDEYLQYISTMIGCYTLNKVGLRDIVNFNNSLNGDFYYLRRPQNFYIDPNGITTQSLSLPYEYHFEVCCLTAELINDLDVNEQERGETVYQNQRLNLKDNDL
jgi:hypothetical protein